MKLPESRGEAYTFTDQQNQMVVDYIKIVDLLKQAGYPAAYRQFWVRFPEENPGYIVLEMKNEAVSGG